MKHNALNPSRFTLPLLCLVFSLFGSQKAGAAVFYWNPNGTTSVGGSATWDLTTKQWSSLSSQSAAASLVVWNTANAACFSAGPSSGVSQGNFTIAVNSAISFAGIFNGQLNPGPQTVTLNGTGSLSLNAGVQGFSTFNSSFGFTTIQVPITGSGQVNPSSSGNLYLYGNNTYSGGTLLGTSAGVNFNNNNSFGTGPIIWGSSTTVIANPINNSQGITGATGPITLPNQINAISGTDILVSPAVSPVTLAGNWQLPSTGTATFTTQPTLALGGALTTVSGNLAGTSAFTKGGVGAILLSGDNTAFTGAMNDSSTGILEVGSAKAFGSSPVVTVASGAVLDLNGTTGIDGAISIGGTGISSGGAIINSNSTTTASLNSGAIAGVTVSGGGTLITAPATATFSGGGGSGATATPDLGVTAASFTVTSGTQTYSAAPAVTISGGGGTNATATATLTSGSVTAVTITAAGYGFTAAPTLVFSGGTVLASGSVPTATGNATHFTLTGVIVNNHGSGYTSLPTLTLSTGTSVTTAAKLDGVTMTANSSMGGVGNLIVNSPVSGAFALTKVGAGSLTLNNGNTFTGGATVGSSAGTLVLGNATALGTGALTFSGNSSFDANTPLTVANALTLSGGSPTFVGTANLTMNGAVTLSGANRTITVSANTLTLGGNITGAFGFAKAGAGKIVLNNTNTYTGNTTITGGTLALSSLGSITNSPLIFIGPGTTFDVSAISSYTLTNSLVASNTATIIAASAGSIALGSQPVGLSFTPTSFHGDLTRPALNVTQAALALNGNAVAVTNLAASPLSVGVYTLISNVTGTAGALTLKAGTLTNGTSAVLATSNGNLNLVVQETPTFSALSNPFITGGATVTLTGKLSGAGPIYPANGETITVTINSVAQTTTISDSTGDFSINYDGSVALTAVGSYPVTYSYGGDTSLTVASDSSSTVTVVPPPTVGASTPASDTKNANDTEIFTVSASGGALSYQWFKGAGILSNGAHANGATITGSTAPSITLTHVFASDADSYFCVVSNASGTATSGSSVLTVVDPIITTQPVATINTNAGSTINISVVAIGSTNLTYLWQKNGVNIDTNAYPSATNSTFTLTGVLAADAATYTVAVTNVFGSGIISSGSVLTVVDPYIVTQPVSVTNNSGSFTSFSVTANGTALTYQWNLNGNNITGATASTYTIAADSDADAGTYLCGVTNANLVGLLTAPATLTVIDAPVITDPVSTTVGAGTNAIFSISQTSGSAALYQWYKGASPLSNSGHIIGSATTSLTIVGANDPDVTSYTVSASNSAGTPTSAAAILTVIHAPVITVAPHNILIPFNGTSNLSVAISGSTSSYQWIKGTTSLSDGGDFSGSTSNVLTIANATGADIDTYTVVIANLAGTITSSPVTVGVVTVPTIGQQPVSANVSSVSNAVFSVTAIGAPVLTYQWSQLTATATNVLVDNTGYVLGAATNASLTLTTLDHNAEGTYVVHIHNGSGDADSDGTSVLLVFDAPVITTQPVSASVGIGTNSTFAADFTGTALTYQWYKVTASATNTLANTGNITGATSTNLTITGSAHTDEATYRIIASNIAGTATNSPDVSLTVYDVPVINVPPVSQTNVAGATVNFHVTLSLGANPSYQWKKGGVNLSNIGNITGANTANLTVGTIATGDQETYSVVVSNVAGSTSASATLTVINAPVITDPSNQTVGLGTNAVFSITQTSGSAAVYQWFKGASPLSNGTHIAGSTTTSLTILGTVDADAGTFHVAATNLAGAPVSANATLTIIDPPIITVGLTNAIRGVGSNMVFTATVTGSTSAYSWSKTGTGLLSNGGNIAGATTASLTITGPATTDAGTYTLTATNLAASASSTATLTIVVTPTMSTPLNVTVGLGTNAVITSTQTAGDAAVYRWFKGAIVQNNSTHISGVITTSLTINGTTDADAGSFHIVATNVAGSFTSGSGVLTIIDPPIVSVALTNVNVGQGTNAIFTATISGTSPAYSWVKTGFGTLSDGGNIVGSTSSSLTVLGASPSDSGTYTLTATNLAATVTTSSILNVGNKPVITGAPTGGGNFTSPANTTLGVSVTGTAPLAYQWKKGGVNLSNGGSVTGSTSSILSLTSMTFADTGSYTVVVTNASGSASSTFTVVNVQQGPVILTQPKTQSIGYAGAGSNAVTFTVVAGGNPGVSYQWSFDGAPIAGATASAYTVANATTANVGFYSVVVTNTLGSITSSSADLLISAYYFDPLTVDSSSGWTTNSQGVNRTTWNYDYSADGVPQNSSSASTKALKLEANYTGVGSIASINLSPTSQIFTNDYQLRYNVWLNSEGPNPFVSGTVLSQSTTAGVGNTGAGVQLANGANANGVWFQANSDGAFAFNASGNYPDFSVFIGNTLQRTNTGLYAAGLDAHASDNTSPYYASTFPGQSAPALQQSLYPATQTGTSAAGTLAYAWHQVIVKKVSNVVTWSIDGLKIASVTNATLTGSNVFIGYLDPNASVADNSSVVFGLYSNFRVEPVGAETGLPGITINTQPVSQTNIVNGTTTFSVSATASYPITYQWQKNGSDIAGATGSSLVISSEQTSDDGTYVVHLYTQGAYAISTPATLSVSDPVVTSNPQNASAECGSVTNLTVTAIGGSTLHYQWYKSPSTPVGTDSNQLTFNPASVSDSGAYYVVVSDLAGSATSSSATVTISDTIPPVVSVITTSPQTIQCHTAFTDDGATATDVCAGDVTGSIVVTGTLLTNTPGVYTLTYTAADASGNHGSATRVVTVIDTIAPTITITGGTPVNIVVQTAYTDAGATAVDTCNPSVSVASSGTVDTNVIGAYTITYTSGDGNGNTNVAYRTVNVTPFSPTISGTTPSGAVNAGTDMILSVTNSGQTPYAYFWQKNGTNLAGNTQFIGVNTSSLTVTNVLRTNAGNYTVLITNTSGSITSAPIAITVNDPAILTQPHSLSVNSGTNAVFTVSVGGTAVKYQWYYVSNSISHIQAGQTSNHITVVSGPSKVGGYYVIATNTFGSVTSDTATLSFAASPVITLQPAALTLVTVGQSMSLSIAATGDAPLAYQWLHNSTVIAGQTSNHITLTNLQTTDSGTYQCTVTNISGIIVTSTNTRGFVVVTNTPVKITTAPGNFSVVAGNKVTFTVVATGTKPLAYQWKENGGVITDATNSTYLIANAQEIGSNNFYSCVVSNPTNSVESITNSPAHGQLTVKADTNKPTVSITYPAANARLTNLISYTYGTTALTAPQFELVGGVTDNGLVTNVTIFRTFPTSDTTPAVFTLSAPGIGKFTNTLTFENGTNTYVVTVQDSAGNSNSVTRSFFFVNNTTMLYVTNNGFGSNAPVGSASTFTAFGTPTNGAFLEIGRNYTIKAMAAGNNVFTNWTDSNGLAFTTNVQLTFKMSSNLVLNANFITNPIVAGGANGKYNGLFSEASAVSVESAGSILNLTVATNRTFSGTLNLQGRSFTVAKTFDTSGDVTFTIVRTNVQLNNLTVSLHLDWSGVTKQITGTIVSTNAASTPWTADVVLDEAVFSTNNPYAAARYTMGIASGDSSGLTAPAGTGYAAITNTTAGVSSLVGKLADGTSISATQPISKDGNIPFSVKLYNNLGLVQGWLNYTTTTVTGSLTWIRPATNPPATYTAGFTNVVAAAGTLYLKPGLGTNTVFGNVNTNFVLSLLDTEGFSLDASAAPLVWHVQLKGNSFVINTNFVNPTNKFTTAVVSTTDGTVSIGYHATSAGPAVTKTLVGIIDQVNTNAGGYFIGTSSDGSFTLHP